MHLLPPHTGDLSSLDQAGNVGSRIAFHSNRDGNVEIYVMKPDGSGLTRLTDNPTTDANADWAPNGRRIAFQS